MESFWAKQQSCITLKVSLRKWCPFFVFVCFSGCHFTQDRFTKKDNVQKNFFKFLHVFLTFLHIIFKIWKYIMLLSFPSQNSRCATTVSICPHVLFFAYKDVHAKSHCPVVALIYEKNNTSPIFRYVHHFCQTNNFSFGGLPKTDVLFCKSSLSKMASVKTNKNKNWTPLLKTNFS